MRSLHEKPVPLRYLDNVQDSEDVSGLLEDLQEAVNDYLVRPLLWYVLDPDLDNRWCNKWRSTTRDVNSWWVPPFNVRMNKITLLDRMEVRIFSIPDDKYLIGGFYS